VRFFSSACGEAFSAELCLGRIGAAPSAYQSWQKRMEPEEGELCWRTTVSASQVPTMSLTAFLTLGSVEMGKIDMVLSGFGSIENPSECEQRTWRTIDSDHKLHDGEGGKRYFVVGPVFSFLELQ